MRSALCATALTALAGCQVGSAFRDPMARLNPDMATVIEAYIKLGAEPVHELSVQAARAQPTIDDAVKAVEQGQSGKPVAMPFVKITDMTVPGAAGPLQARLYDATPGHPHEPIILYFHGGFGVIGSLDSADFAVRALATQAHAMVLSVAYRLAPEAPFPAQMDDGFAAYQWLLGNAASLGADPRRIAVGGESVGATIAIDTAIAARDAGIKLPVHELLIEPVASADLRTRSAIANQYTVPLDRADVNWYFGHWVPNDAALADPRIDLINHADVHGLPPTTVISSEMDPLDSDGYVVTQKLLVAGVDVARVEYAGTAHGFFGTGAVVARAAEAESFAATALDATFTKIGEPPPPRPVERRPARQRPMRHEVYPPIRQGGIMPNRFHGGQHHRH
jgi:acetyl esterase/lipase